MIRATLALAILLCGAGALLYGAFTAHANAADLAAGAVEELRGLARGEMERLVVRDTPDEPMAAEWVDGQGNPVSLSDYAGKVVVLNLWATWCPPCRAEMPSLDRLAGAMADQGVAVIALSGDRGATARVAAFLNEIGARHLAVSHDPSGAVARRAGVLGLPATLLLDRQGREVARLIGDADWDSPEAHALMRRLAELTAPVELRNAAAGAEPEG